MTKKEIYFKIKKFVNCYSRRLGKNKFSKLCNMAWGKINSLISLHKYNKYSIDDLIDMFEIMQYEFHKNIELEPEQVRVRIVRW